MALRTIVTPPDPVLRQRAVKVRRLTPHILQLVDDMLETMREAPGVGLAAPQVGVSQRVIVVEYTEPVEEEEEAEKPPKVYVMVNPEILRKSTEMMTGTEACLSVPGYAGTVERHAWITIRGLNGRGQPVRVKAQGWLARIFQHEIDHLDGILYIDRATQVWKPEDTEAIADTV
jgi:peptide deformylase